MAHSNKSDTIYRTNGRINPLGDDRFILDDYRMHYSDDPYDEAAFYVQRSSLSCDTDTNGSLQSNVSHFISNVESNIFKAQISRPGGEDEADIPLLNGSVSNS